MKERFADWPATTRLSLFVLAISAVVMSAEMVRFLTFPDTNSPSSIQLRDIKSYPARSSIDEIQLLTVAQHSPFWSIGAAGASGPVVVPAASSPQSRPLRPRLLGTVLEASGSFVVVELPEGQIQVVHIGERAGPLRLIAVSAGAATFSDPDGARVTLRSVAPESQPRP